MTDDDALAVRANLVLALVVHAGAGFFWLFAVYFGAAAIGGVTVALLWVLGAIVLSVTAGLEMARERRRPARVWWLTFRWWLQTFVSPIFVALLLLGRRAEPAAEPRKPQRADEVSEPVTGPLLERIERAEAAVQRLQAELAELRRLAAGAAQPAPHWQRQTVAVAASPPPPPPPPPPTPPPPQPVREEPPGPPPRWQTIEPADLLGARALAWAGGVVTLLGVVFFFVLAVNAGWIGPVERVGLGALASALVFGAGVVAHRRYGNLYSALAATGAGIAGGYATLLSAAALYDLVPALGALGLAAGIAALGTSFSLAWRAELLAGLGLVGAMLVPVTVALDGGLSRLGTAFAALVFAGAAVVAVRERWPALLAVSGLASFPQMLVLGLDEGASASGRVVVLAAVFALLALGAGLAWQRAAGEGRLEPLAVSYLVASAALATVWFGQLLTGDVWGIDRAGAAILAAAALYGVLAATTFRRDRELSALLGALGLMLSAIALAALLAGGSLALIWAAEAVVLAWLAGQIAESRYGVGALAYVALAIGHVLALEAPPTDLFTDVRDPGEGALLLAAIAVAALAVGLLARRWNGDEPVRGVLAPLVARFVRERRWWSVAGLGAGTLLAVDAASLGVLELLERSGVARSFDWGQAAVTALWCALGLATLVARRPALMLVGSAWLGVTVAKWLALDVPLADGAPAGWAALALAASLLAAGLIRWLAAENEREDVGMLFIAASTGIAAFAADRLVDGSAAGVDLQGLAFLLGGALYATLAAVVWRRRELATLLWLLGLALALAASPQLVSGTALVAAWAGAAVVLAWLGARLHEPRLELASAGFVVLSLGRALLLEAPPNELFLIGQSPADGVPELAFGVLALGAVTLLGDRTERIGDRLDAALAQARGVVRPWALWAVGVLIVYGVSLTLLELSQALGGADLTTEFQRGHTAVSAFWGLVGLVALYLGLTRGRQSLRLAGFALFGVSLAKLFLYDLGTLSSVTRALSFLAVGAVLLLAGFFYQRLAAEQEEGNRQPVSPA
jgi:uncharacterized membrane protein